MHFPGSVFVANRKIGISISLLCAALLTTFTLDIPNERIGNVTASAVIPYNIAAGKYRKFKCSCIIYRALSLVRLIEKSTVEESN